MKKSLKYRETILDARRIVIKIGSRVLVQKTGRPDVRCMRNLIGQMAKLHKSGREIVIITSGAVGAGMEALGMKKRPSHVPDLQMAAAVGQCRLMSRYDELFSKVHCRVGQILLTHTDFQHKIRLTNARRTIENLIRNKVIPVINENDVVADEEIRADMSLGDNDYLASLVVNLIRSDLLIILTTVDGLREPGNAAGRTKRVKYLESITRNTYKLISGTSSNLSKGGMATKLKAAHSVSKTGCSVVIANGRSTSVLDNIMDGLDIGTMILA